MGDQRRLPPGKTLSYAIQSAVLFTLVGFLRRFDTDRASDIGAWVGRNLLAPFGRSGRSTLETLRIAYPDLSDEEAGKLLTGTYGNIGRIIAEMAMLERFVGGSGRSRFTFHGLEHLEAAQSVEAGMIIATGHFANWEMIGVALHHLGVPFSAVTRPPNNPWVARWIEQKRASMGTQKQIPKGADGTRLLFSALRQAQTVVMLIDQHLAQGVPSPLFGREAMTTHAPATFAGKLGIAVLPMAVRRRGGSRFDVVFHAPLRFPATGNESRDVLEMTAALNRFVEDEVRLRPEHWLWMHRRWKPVETMTPRAERMLEEAGAGLRA